MKRGFNIKLFTFLFFSHPTLYGQLNLQDSSILPLVVINTFGNAIMDEPKITAHMGIVRNPQGMYNKLSDSFNEYNGYIGIEERGSSSLNFPKKGYGLETRDSIGENNNVELFGMPKENDWILHGPYSDKSLIRNFLAYYYGRKMYNYSPRTQFVELLIDNDYKGVYLFVEKIKRDDGRVDISKLDQDDLLGDSLTGGYIIKIDKSTGSNNASWTSSYQTNSSNPRNVSFLYHYPKADEIKPSQESYIQAFISNFENSLYGANFLDSNLGYRQYIDINSFVDYYLLNEATRNVDGYRISTFLYKNKDSKNNKLFIGPPWDYNLGWGNADYCDGGSSTGWASDFNFICPGDNFQIPFWWQKMLSDPEFLNRLNCRWNELRQGPFNTDSINDLIDSVSLFLQEPATRNFSKWNILNNWVWPNNFVGGSYLTEIGFIKNWINDRFLWIDNNLPGFATDCSFLSFQNQDLFSARLFPNPFTEIFFIDFYNNKRNEKISISIYDISGILVSNYSTVLTSSGTISSTEILKENSLSKGIYIINIRKGIQNHNFKIIKQ